AGVLGRGRVWVEPMDLATSCYSTLTCALSGRRTAGSTLTMSGPQLFGSKSAGTENRGPTARSNPLGMGIAFSGTSMPDDVCNLRSGSTSLERLVNQAY